MSIGTCEFHEPDESCVHCLGDEIERLNSDDIERRAEVERLRRLVYLLDQAIDYDNVSPELARDLAEFHSDLEDRER